MTSNEPRVLIVAEHASANFGGEATLPFHYFRILRQRQIEVWMVVHDRTRDELKQLLGADFDRIHFITDTSLHRFLDWLCQFLPHRLAYFTLGFVVRLMTQAAQRCLAKQLVQRHQITVVHQPIPVSPKEPSLIFAVDAPVLIGPMNGGMNYPPAFQKMQSRFVHVSLAAGRLLSKWLNWLIPGKRQAAMLLVANARTRAALPKGVCSNIVELCENGVDLSVWQQKPESVTAEAVQPIAMTTALAVTQATKFVFVGRLLDWKAVDLLLLAFERVAKQMPVVLEIIGDGPEGLALKQQAVALGLRSLDEPQAMDQRQVGNELQAVEHAVNMHPDSAVHFLGWLSQADCAQRLCQSDVMVLPSLLECGGAAVLESMSIGLPVIATNWGGPTDYLDESCGILVEPQSRESFIDGLAAAMLRLASSPSLRRSMGEAGRQRVLSHFDWEVKVDTILKLYREVMPMPLLKQPVISQKTAGQAVHSP
ncbi:glycosyltransferase family 4 protein [Leptolyngbya sp. FACHB-321]|uniref:glycosyltransferase family 4 protein n=1 Tax=Leptolyngbya sp. FACHB-321 TaxID=2692807 RepID=UPI001684FEC3|nr:glycosyltransferase family 4 protein [Leptolyngbya sp. FACHB-321]MBD2037226.1 glycosyltransferase family 4 protein [Leptolyngbya sp. FACHB-321]